MSPITEQDIVHSWTYISHQRSEGVLCWGGPEHGQVVRLPDEPSPVHLFPIERRMGYTEPQVQSWMGIQTVAYDVKKFGTAYGAVRESWPVLVYQENRERLERNLEAHAAFVLWMCGGADSDSSIQPENP